ncbi:segmentation protein cap'n'collar isoform X6 [Procambarus clarkii]|uniref:segmentation protein cap'n'collar isoform X6 n=1 Tax=Procambarus clarkii TaxID=6728 RepID=UPI001E6759D6|nr:endoplasmic reticulum membrane sensor NFE2L1-like isoform X5 [Procambarus clarkii]
MLLYARKKYLRDERVLQLVLLLSLLRGDPDTLLGPGGNSPLADLPHDLILGSSLGHARPSSPMIIGADLHPKSLDRILADYQRSVLDDLHALGRYTSQQQAHALDVQAYLLNSHTSLPSPPTADTPDHHHQPPTSPPTQPNHLLPDPPPPDYNLSDDLTPEDLALIEALWKQDVDLGVPRELFEEDVETFTDAQTKDKDHGKKPKGDTKIDEKSEDNVWMQLNFTIDSETGEQLLSPESQISGGDVTFEPVSPLNSPSFTLNETVPELNLDFNLDEALKFVGLNCSETGETTWKLSESDSNSDEVGKSVSEKEKEESEDSLDALNDTLDDMIQASQLHSHHPRSLQVRWAPGDQVHQASQHQGRLGSLVRSGEMERWQEVVQYLGLPNPHHTQAPHTPMAAHSASPTHSHGHGTPLHHPHALYPTHDSSPATPAAPVPRGVLINNATLPPPMSDPMSHNITYTNSMGASSHLVTSSMNLTNSSELAGSDHNQYKMETSTSLPSEMMYYQNTSTEMNQTTDGLLSSILNDEALGLMEMAMSDSGCVLPQLHGEEGVDASSDSAVSSLSPGEPWGTVDNTTQLSDSGSRNQSGDYNAGSYRYGPEDPHRMPPLPLKKQHMFGRGGATGNLGGNSSGGVGNVGGYGSPYPPPPTIPTMEGATALDPAEMKYSCTMDFRSQGEVSGSGVEHVQHNHTYHMSPEGPSGLTRPTARDKQRNRKNEHERTLTRDEKRARNMNLPITCEDIINLPMDEFNERISKYDLTEAQLSLIRDIRRRGKNKVAAQNCRKRKLDQILHLADEVKAIQTRKNDLYNEFEYLNGERTRIKHKFSLLYRHIFQSLRDPDGNPYSPHEYSLQQSADGSILLVPRSSPSHSMDPSASNKPRGKDDPK